MQDNRYKKNRIDRQIPTMSYDMDGWMDGWMERQKERKKERKIERQKDRQIDRQIDDGQKDKEVSGQIRYLRTCRIFAQ